MLKGVDMLGPIEQQKRFDEKAEMLRELEPNIQKLMLAKNDQYFAVADPRKRFYMANPVEINNYNNIFYEDLVEKVIEKLPNWGKFEVWTSLYNESYEEMADYHALVFNLLGIKYLVGLYRWTDNGLISLSPVEFIQDLPRFSIWERIRSFLGL